MPRPEPTDAELLAQALLERATVPAEGARGLRALTRAPRQVARAGAASGSSASARWRGRGSARRRRRRFNVPIGPHRRYTWVDSEVARFKAIKNALGGTLNDVVLSAVALALGRFLRRRGVDTDGLVLKAMVPVSVRADDAARRAGQPRGRHVGAAAGRASTDPEAVLAEVAEAMRGLKESGQAVGAVALTSLADFAPPTIMSQAARLQARQRFFNLVVTNVPGPQIPLYLLGRRMIRFYPVVPLAHHQALGIAIMSYDGRLAFGLLGDYDAMGDLEALADDLRVGDRRAHRAAGRRVGPGRRERHRSPIAGALQRALSSSRRVRDAVRSSG